MPFRAIARLFLVAVTSLIAIPSALAQETLPSSPDDQVQPPPPSPEYSTPPVTTPAPPPPVAPASAYEPPKHEHHHRHSRIFAPGTVGLTTGAGVTNYFGSGVSGALDPGAAWDARLTLGTGSVIALEAGYVGSSNNFATLEGGGHVISNGLDGDLRLQIPLRVEPYIFGGVGYNHMALYNRTLLGATSDDQFTVPAGAGLTGYIGRHATLDVRGTYRFTPDNGITFMAPTSELHQWVAQAHLGYVF
jgi:hypothetical protein